MARDIVGLKINADLLDGLSASDFAQVSGSATFSGSVTATNLVVDDDGTIGSATTPGAVTIASGGNVTLTDNLVFASGQGIDFSATSDAAGSTSELLDDYEEGTWTPEYAFAISGSVTYNIRSGYYTKIGNLVVLKAYVRVNTTSNPTGNVTVTGLPFSIASSADVNHRTASRGMLYSWNTDMPNFTIEGYGGGTTFLRLRKQSSNTPAVSEVQGTDLANGAELEFTISYRV